jgi:hypothetical protein
LHETVAGLRDVQIEVADPAQRRFLLGGAALAPGLVGRVGAEQVVAAEPARGVLGQQVRAGQLGQGALRAGGRPG